MQDQRIKLLSVKETNLRDQYENKVMSALKKGKIDEQTKNELIIMVAEQFGIEEQLYSLRHNCTDERRKDFINNLNEIDFSNFEIELLLDDANKDYLKTKYKTAETLPESLQKVFDRNNDKFVKILKQFCTKRNVYRKNENSNLLEELVLLKCNLIKHLCVMEKLIMSK
ncbi:protein kinase interacting protein [Spodoptera exempta nucleopolyhedrovirus]|uniref:Protein kinase interacting protein n=1 Tax=Spodoptera exempta nucleopolyhedrovirus TaxID=1242863 RepID=A0A410S7K7_9ABAC|nr:protein kinase interacting protein [Spodoptera exempta nucleopolyhedrovirus]QAT90312.1 protein kinase interacting protein [Spodoptera exempta nucleopolyhedrovirus]